MERRQLIQMRKWKIKERISMEKKWMILILEILRRLRYKKFIILWIEV